MCLDSVRAQTLKDIEIVCVNDGSPDYFCKPYLHAHPWTIVLSWSIKRAVAFRQLEMRASRRRAPTIFALSILTTFSSVLPAKNVGIFKTYECDVVTFALYKKHSRDVFWRRATCVFDWRLEVWLFCAHHFGGRKICSGRKKKTNARHLRLTHRSRSVYENCCWAYLPHPLIHGIRRRIKSRLPISVRVQRWNVAESEYQIKKIDDFVVSYTLFERELEEIRRA